VLLALSCLAGSAETGELWGWLGVRIRDLSEAEMEELSAKLGLREGYGVMIAEIIKDTPAAVSDLREGDLIVSIDGGPVTETRALQRVVGAAPPGRTLAVTVLRSGRRSEVRIAVGAMPPDIVAERVAAEFGFLVRPAPRDEPAASSPPSGPSGGGGAGRGPGAGGPSRPPLAVASGAPPGTPVVVAVGEGSSAARAGLAVGDRILAVGGVTVDTLEALRGRLQDQLLRDQLVLSVERRGEPRTVVLPPAREASGR
jgi:serine protease Do